DESKEGPEHSGLFAYLNTNKRSLALDIKQAETIAALKQLLTYVDVVICDRPDEWLQHIGLSADQWQQQSSNLIVCAITPFGYSELAEQVHAQDINAMHSSGWGYHTPSAADASRPPLKGAGRFLASYEAGLDAAMCITAALFEREDSGSGQFIDISKQATLASRADYVLAQMIAGDMNVSADRKAYDLHGPADIYPCKDGHVYIWLSAPAHWQALAKLLGEPEWMNEFPSNWLECECTPERVAQCRLHIGQWIAGQNKNELAQLAQELGLILVPVNHTDDLLKSPQYQHRHFFEALTHPVLGKLVYPTVPYQLSKTPAKLHSAAPLLGQHTEQTLSVLSTQMAGERA
ncbi:MAG: CoA transferase, partial [Spongiibacteraceae bacterium]|nr:CoA transferase [Spongiibacteraceae bacterium]